MKEMRKKKVRIAYAAWHLGTLRRKSLVETGERGVAAWPLILASLAGVHAA